MGLIDAAIKGINALLRGLMTVIVFLFRPPLLVFVFKFTSIIAIVIFIFAYYHAFQTYRLLHKQYEIGSLQSKECGYEYMEKESGITHLFQALTNPENPLKDRFQQSLNNVIYIIALLSLAVLAITLYYLTNDADKPSFRRDAANPTWINITKVGLYLRYILLPSIAAIGLLVYYNNRKEIYIPDFNKELKRADENDADAELEDPVLRQEKTKELDRGIDATVSRQWTAPMLLVVIMLVIVRFYTPDVPISKALLFTVFVVLVLSTLILTGLTRFYGKLQLILHSKYLDSIKQLNQNVAQMIRVPEFKDYYLRNAQRLEKYSDEPFQENQINRLEADGKLYQYIQHHASRNDELEFMTKIQQARTRTNKTLTWSPVVHSVRAELNTLRMADAEIKELFRKNNFKLVGTFLIPILLVIYIVFHVLYKNSPGTTIAGVIGLLVLLYFFTFFKNTMSLVKPQDPQEEIVVPVEPKKT
jgi:hypothetical protein